MDSVLQDRTTQYALDVRDGRQVAGRLVRQACERHLADLERAAAKGWLWKVDEAERVINFFPDMLCLPEESDADEDADDEREPVDGEPFTLQPWQQFIAGSLM